jgi:hypothetical protein
LRCSSRRWCEKEEWGGGDFDTKIKILCWNIRGLGGKGRRKQLKELMYKYKVDVICLQETMKEHFTLSELRELVGNNVLDGTGQLHKGIQGGGGGGLCWESNKGIWIL